MATQKAKAQRKRRAKVNKVTAGYRVSEELWAVLQPLLPESVNSHRFGGGRPRVPDRQCANAIFYVFRTGCQWGALDATGLCPHSTAHDRFQHGVEAGVFLRLWQTGVEQVDELKGLDWSWVSMDGAMTKAPLGGEKTRSQSDRPRQKRRQTPPADRSPRGPHRTGGRGSQSARHEVG
jgi:putative transposase